MTRSPRANRILAVWLAVAALGAAAEAVTITAHDERELALPPDRTLVIQNVNGGVSVGVWDQATVRLQAVRTVKGSNRERAQQALDELVVEVVEEAARLLVRTRQPRSEGGWLGWLRGGDSQASVSYTLTVPRHARLEVTTVNGRVEVRGLQGDLRASSTNGGITLHHVGGSVSASSTNGSIQATVTSLGDRDGVELRTVNGAIRLGLPLETRADVDARTVNGSISTDFPLTAGAQRSRSRLVGSFNGGGSPVRLRTTNGSVRVQGLE